MTSVGLTALNVWGVARPFLCGEREFASGLWPIIGTGQIVMRLNRRDR